MDFLVIFILVITVYIAAYVYTLWKQQNLKKTRKGQDITTFIQYFSGEDVSEDICFKVYRYIQKTSLISNFPVHPKDEIASVYGICDEDLVDTIVELAQICGSQVHSEAETVDRNNIQVLLIEDLVRFLSSSNRVN